MNPEETPHAVPAPEAATGSAVASPAVAGSPDARVRLVTGAGGGLGRAVALACAARGDVVILLGRRVAPLEATYDAIEAAGGRQPAIFPLDLSRAFDKEFDQLADAIAREFGRLDGMVHCAAHLPNLSPLAFEDLAHWLTSLRVNLAAPFALTRACLPLLRMAPDAPVVFVGDRSALQARPNWGAFGVAKAGLATMVRMWDQELADQPGPRVNLFVPGPMHSPQRLRTHPGEAKDGLPRPAEVAEQLLAVLDAGATGPRGQLVGPGVPEPPLAAIVGEGPVC